MANNNARSKYIQQISEDMEKYAQTFSQIGQDALTTLLDEQAKKTFRQMISESGDEYTEDETEDPTKKDSQEKESDSEATEIVTSSTEDDNKSGEEGSDIETSVQTELQSTEGGEDAKEDGWDEYEEYSLGDGKYDFSNMGNDELLKVFRRLDADDTVSVIPQGDNAIQIQNKETGDDLLVVMPNQESQESELGESKDVVDNYQKINAINVDNNKEVANPKTTYSMDAGAPEGAQKPFPGEGDNAPFNQEVNKQNEEFNVSLESGQDSVNEGPKTVNRHASSVHGVTMSAPQNSESNTEGRNSHIEGEQKHSTSENPYSTTESIQRTNKILKKASEIFEQNKQLRQLLQKAMTQINEMVVNNKSLGHIANLFIEHTLTPNEKQQIVTQFTGAKTVADSTRIYESISRDLKNRVLPKMEPQVSINESVNNSVTKPQPMFSSNNMTDFMQRMDEVYRRKPKFSTDKKILIEKQ